MQNQYLTALNLQPGATKAEIKSAYRRLSKIYHPDVSKDPQAKEKFIEINEAYKFLTDVGPRPTYFQSSPNQTYDYNPDIDHFEEHRRKARAYARKKAQEAVRRQIELIKYLLRSFDTVAYLILAFNLSLILDWINPPTQKTENATEIRRVSESRGRGRSSHRYDDVYYPSVMFRLDKGKIYDVDYRQPATTYVSQFMKVPLYVDYQMPDGRTARLYQSYSVYNTFGMLIIILFAFFVIYRFVPQSLDSQLTWAIFMVFMAGFQQYIYLKF